MKVRLDYNETCMIVNALHFYTTFCDPSTDEDFKKRFVKRVYDVIDKFELLENQILQLTAEREVEK